MRIIGLTGGIASGKSSVSKMLSYLGAAIIDADVIARDVVQPGQKVFQKIIEEFGDNILKADGTIDRKKLGYLVFNDRDKLNMLNSITHPEIIRIIEERVEAIRAEGKYDVIVIDAPLLLESGMKTMVDEVWLVFADMDTQLKRLMLRDGLDIDTARDRIMSQMPMEEKIKLSHRIIDNSKDLEHTKKQVLMLWYDITGRM